MPASRSKKRSSSSRKSSATKRHVAKTRGPFRHFENFGSEVKGLELGIVPTGTGGFDVGFVPKGRKQTTLKDMMYGNAPSRKMTEVDRYRAATAAYGAGNELDASQKIRCLQDEYRNLKGECTPAPAEGMSIYNYSNPTNTYINRPGILGGSERIVRHTRPDGRQVNRIETMNSTNGWMSMLMNPGSEESEGFYDANGEKRKFMDPHYSQNYKDGTVVRKIPDGFVPGPNSTACDGSDQLYGKIYKANDNMGMARDGLKWAIYKGRPVAAPVNYLNGRSTLPGQRPISTAGLSIGSMFGLSEYPPKRVNAGLGTPEALFGAQYNNQYTTQPPLGVGYNPAWVQPRATSTFRNVGRYW